MSTGKKLSLQQIEDVELLIKHGLNNSEIARITDISPKSIKRIRNNEQVLQKKREYEKNIAESDKISNEVNFVIDVYPTNNDCLSEEEAEAIADKVKKNIRNYI